MEHYNDDERREWFERACQKCASLRAELSACREQLDEALQSAQREVARLETEAMERSAANASFQSSLPTDPTRIGEIRECANNLAERERLRTQLGAAPSAYTATAIRQLRGAADALTALQQRVSDWRAWAQFVYGNGGPVPDVSDDAMRETVCRAHDAQVQALQQRVEQVTAQLDSYKAVAVSLDREVESERARRVAAQEAITFHWRPKLEAAEATIASLRSTLEKLAEGHNGQGARRIAMKAIASLSSSPVSPREEER